MTMKDVLTLLVGVGIGLALALILSGQPHDNCQARVSSGHLSVCLDSKFQKAKELFR
ncbi:hypothetical protein [Bradyrhizobium elkanii]|uniref:Uncharacterized protein n=1 Tax=Bradyrhizobium diazoefficiens TaxID=1355477 RepID=A0A809X435_9BRAD|nr:hypothetical protein [Bradyrhizobium elkanii]BCE22056.1 hypothetical protein XF1B_47370 [Bradyrhizobium diazoefficiens]WLB04115.1 hypothetical protein QNJ80_19880 [Bradyrhizobium elkanii]WLB84925.1 hypothetical protein QIH83_21210 [Bradyrhizobium elkanii]BCE48321.1 hypothetical protein XF4B_46700 [Bradyrhizobium diazoefficiens]BCE91837.1 hypothetical protein XF10B_46350 [Bradyrhizobium diazoefficiens]